MKHTKKLFSVAIAVLAAVSMHAQDKSAQMHQKAQDLISQMTVEEKIGLMMNHARGVERLGIKPYDWWNEALHGVARFGRATVFPEPLGLGATFDAKLIRSIGDVVAAEGRAKYEVAQAMENYNQYTGLTFWAPNVNIYRDPRWGRGMETYGEDPFLSGTLGSAYVKGIQGDDPFYLKAAACGKHFAVHSGPEALRHTFNAEPSSKDLYETYLPAFEKLVKDAKVEVIMGAYNRVYGESASGSKFLLTDILRDKWGFQGHIVSDCDAVRDIYANHKIVNDAAAACAVAIKAGLNLECGTTFFNMKSALDRGLLTEADIDKALEPLLLTWMKLGILFKDPDFPYYGVPESVVASEEHVMLAREAARKSMVLLKNSNDILPLQKDMRNMIVVGPGASNAYSMMGNYFGIANHYSTYLEGIASKISAGTNLNYKMGFPVVEIKERNSGNYAISHAATADYTIMFMGNDGSTEGEESDAIASPISGDHTTLALPKSQMDFFRTVVRQRRPNNHLIVVVTGGSPVELAEIEKSADAIIMAWYPGQEGGNALAELMFGEANFSGRLPITFPEKTELLPDFEDYSMQGRTYKYMDSNIFYPFGYGLSYSSVEYGELSMLTKKPKHGNEVEFEIPVTNTGAVEVEETVQFYVSTPGAGQWAPISQLVGFEKVSLKSGESKTLRFTLTPDMMREFQEDGATALLKGNYKFTASSAAPSARTVELGIPVRSASFKL